MTLIASLLALLAAAAIGTASPAAQTAEELLVSSAELGRYGDQIVVNERTEPKTLNPITAVDAVSREIVRFTIADLIHINRETQRTEPALAKTWTTSPDGRR